MSYKDLREWLNEVERMKEVRTLRGADWDLEIGAIREMVEKVKDSPAVLFDEIRGYPKGFRLLLNSMGSVRRLALSVSATPEDSHPLSLVKSIKAKLKDLKLIPPKFVKEGPILENVIEGADINALMFPAPKWNELDGGRYLGTGGVDITRDPDDGSINLGTYRVQIHDKGTLGFYISPGKHGRIHRDKCFSRGEPCKVALAIGDPSFLLAGGLELPFGQSEYDFIGGIKGEPVEVIESPYSGLPIPARAEIVIEGESYPKETITEGPFGEFTGYYASAARPEPFFKIKRILHRNDPILLTAAPGKPPYENAFPRQFMKSAAIWDQL
jgi:4-hydroxy-3-polyprenylbenzoate decarboxylase